MSGSQNPESRLNQRVKSIFDDSEESDLNSNDDDLLESSFSDDDNPPNSTGVFKVSINEVLKSSPPPVPLEKTIKPFVSPQGSNESAIHTNSMGNLQVGGTPKGNKYIVQIGQNRPSPPILKVNKQEAFSTILNESKVKNIPVQKPKVFETPPRQIFKQSPIASGRKKPPTIKSPVRSNKPQITVNSAYDSLSLIMGNAEPFPEAEPELPTSIFNPSPVVSSNNTVVINKPECKLDEKTIESFIIPSEEKHVNKIENSVQKVDKPPDKNSDGVVKTFPIKDPLNSLHIKDPSPLKDVIKSSPSTNLTSSPKLDKIENGNDDSLNLHNELQNNSQETSTVNLLNKFEDQNSKAPVPELEYISSQENENDKLDLSKSSESSKTDSTLDDSREIEMDANQNGIKRSIFSSEEESPCKSSEESGLISNMLMKKDNSKVPDEIFQSEDTLPSDDKLDTVENEIVNKLKPKDDIVDNLDAIVESKIDNELDSVANILENKNDHKSDPQENEMQTESANIDSEKENDSSDEHVENNLEVVKAVEEELIKEPCILPMDEMDIGLESTVTTGTEEVIGDSEKDLDDPYSNILKSMEQCNESTKPNIEGDTDIVKTDENLSEEECDVEKRISELNKDVQAHENEPMEIEHNQGLENENKELDERIDNEQESMDQDKGIRTEVDNKHTEDSNNEMELNEEEILNKTKDGGKSPNCNMENENRTLSKSDEMSAEDCNENLNTSTHEKSDCPDEVTSTNDFISNIIGNSTENKEANETRFGSIRIKSDLMAEPENDSQQSPITVPRLKIRDNIFSESIDKKKKIARVEDVFTDSDEDQGNTGLANNQLKKTRKPRKPRPEGRFPTPEEINLYMEAFKAGWRRQLVERSSAKTSNRADVYYLTPSGKKLRSRVEIQEYLYNARIKNLTIENFSFLKAPLGVGPEYDEYRLAKLKSTDSDAESLPGSDSALSISKIPKTKKIPNSPLITKYVKKRQRLDDESLPNAKKLNVGKNNTNKNDKIASLQSKRRSVGDSPALFKKHITLPTGGGSLQKIVRVSSEIKITPPIFPPRIVTPLITKELKNKTFHCTPACEGVGGSVPNIQCVKCVCLFHFECCYLANGLMPMIHAGTIKFLCPNCYKESKEDPKQKQIQTPKTIEPHAFDPKSDVSTEDEEAENDVDVSYVSVINTRAATPPSMVIDLKNDTIITQSSPPSATPAPSTTNSNQAQFLQNSLNQQQQQQMNSPCYLIMRPNGTEVSQTIPTSMSNLPIPPVSGGLLIPTGNVLPQMYNSSLQLPVNMGLTNGVPHPQVQQQQQQQMANKPIHFGDNFMMNVSSGYKILKLVFKYLNAAELLKVSKVCSMWRDIAMLPNMWEYVNLGRVLIHDWSKFSTFMVEKGTKVVDMRNTVIKRPSFLSDSTSDCEDKNTDSCEDDDTQSDSNSKKKNESSDQSDKDSKSSRTPDTIEDFRLRTQMYKEELRMKIGKGLGKVTTLRKVILGNCSSDTAYTVLSSCPTLTGIVAMHLCTDQDGPVQFDPGQLLKCPNLEEICLSSTKSFEFKEKVDFKSFKNLTKLVLRNILCNEDDWPNLNSKITSLELSPMKNFNNWKDISAMEGLKELHLEGWDNSHVEMAAAAFGCLTQLNSLTLINWRLSPHMPAIFQSTISLQKLVIVPELESGNETGVQAGRIMAMLEKMRFLRHFSWGLKPDYIAIDVEDKEDHITIWPVKHGSIAYPLQDVDTKVIAVQRLTNILRTKLPFTKVYIKRCNIDGEFES